MYTPQRHSTYRGGNPINAIGGKILGYASIALGFISILIGLIPFVNLFAIVSGILGLIVGFVAFQQSYKGRFTVKYALAGIVLSLLGIVMSFMINDAVLDNIAGDEDEEEITAPATDY